MKTFKTCDIGDRDALETLKALLDISSSLKGICRSIFFEEPVEYDRKPLGDGEDGMIKMSMFCMSFSASMLIVSF